MASIKGRILTSAKFTSMLPTITEPVRVRRYTRIIGEWYPTGQVREQLIAERDAIRAGSHVPAVDDFGNQYLARVR